MENEILKDDSATELDLITADIVAEPETEVAAAAVKAPVAVDA